MEQILKDYIATEKRLNLNDFKIKSYGFNGHLCQVEIDIGGYREDIGIGIWDIFSFMTKVPYSYFGGKNLNE